MQKENFGFDFGGNVPIPFRFLILIFVIFLIFDLNSEYEIITTIAGFRCFEYSKELKIADFPQIFKILQ